VPGTAELMLGMGRVRIYWKIIIIIIQTVTGSHSAVYSQAPTASSQFLKALPTFSALVAFTTE
jgi:hypothetical protein